MNLTRFAFNNVIRNKKAYLAYFFSSSISAALFFIFTMFIMHPGLQEKKFAEYIKAALITTELIAYVFLILFVFYSVSVFLKGRNKEFGTLFILGTSKKHISKIIFIENIIIVGLASIVGSVFGLSFSKFFLLSLSTFLKINGLDFYFPKEAILITIGSFLLLGIVISFLVSFTIRENQVLKLLKGSKAPKKEPKASKILAILTMVVLVGAYYTSTTARIDNVEKLIMPVTIATIIATYFVFSQLIVFTLRILKNNRRFYMKRTNLICISNLFYRIKDNVRMYFIITITSAVAFTSIGALYAYMKSEEKKIIDMYPQAITYTYSIYKEENLEGNENSSSENKINKEDIEVKKKRDKNNIIEDMLNKEGTKYTKFLAERKIVKDSRTEFFSLTLMKESDYNALASALKLSTIDLKLNEALKVANDKTTQLIQDLKSDFMINGEVMKVIGEGKKNVLSGFYADAYVVKDEIFDPIENYIFKENICAFYVEDWYSTLEVSKKIKEELQKTEGFIDFSISSTAIAFDDKRQKNGLNLLVVLFIGVLFFFTTGSFLYNKFYMDVNDDKIKFKNMGKIGVTYNDIKKVITIELGAMFFIPYIVAVVHSSFALSALKNAKNIDVTFSAFLVMGSFFIIQIVYFMVIRAMYLKEIKREIV